MRPHLVHRFLADAAAHLAEQGAGARAVGCALQQVLVRVKVCGRVKIFNVVCNVDKQGVSVAGTQANEMQRGLEPLDFLQ